MKASFFFPIFILLVSQSFLAKSQVYDRKVIHSNDNLANYFTYRFPSFEEGTVLFKNGGSLKSKMNFNTLLCNMQFIDPKGDTLEISKPGEIDSIIFARSVFFFRNGYFETIEASDSIKLVVSRKSSFAPVKIGAMGIPSQGGGVESLDNYSGTGTSKYVKELQLNLNQDLNVLEKTEYFLINKNELVKASKSNFLKLFKDDDKRIENYLKTNKPNFNNQDDLRKLFQFCTHTKA